MATSKVEFLINADTKNFEKNVKISKDKVKDFVTGLGAMKIGTDILKDMTDRVITLGTEFEQAFALTTTLMSGTTAELETQRDELLDLTSQYGITGTKGAEAMYQLLSAGVDTEDSINALNSALKTSIGTTADLTGVVDVGTTVINAYGKDVSELDDVLNVLVETQNAGKTTVDELASSLGQLLPIASSLDVPFEQVTSGLATMTAQGISTSESVTKMKALFTELSKSSTEAGKLLKSETGKSFNELMESGATLTDVLGILEGALERDNLTFNDLFGSVEATSSALSLTGNNVESFNDNLARMTDDVKESDDAFDTMSNTTKNLTNVIKTKLDKVFIKIFNTLSKKMQPILKWISDNMDWLAPIIVTLAIALGTLLTVLGVLLIVKASWLAITVAVSTAVGVLGGIVALLTSPITLVILAVVALIAIFVLFKDDIINALKTAYNFVVDVFVEMWNIIKGFIDKVKEFFGVLVEVLLAPFIKVKEKILEILNLGKGAKFEFSDNRSSTSSVTSKIPANIPKLAVGTNEVLDDGLAMIHKGEAVVPADVVGGGYNSSQNTTIVIEKQDINMDSKKVGEIVTPHITRRIRKDGGGF